MNHVSKPGELYAGPKGPKKRQDVTQAIKKHPALTTIEANEINQKVASKKNSVLQRRVIKGFETLLTTESMPKRGPVLPRGKDSLKQQLDRLKTISFNWDLSEKQPEKMAELRESTLKSIDTKYRSIDPGRDGVSTKFFPSVRYALIGTQPEISDMKEMVLLAKFLNQFGIKLIMPGGYETDDNNITFGKSSEMYRWTQDILEFHNTIGLIKTPCSIDEDQITIKGIIILDRTKTTGRKDLFDADGKNLEILSAVNDETQQELAIKLGMQLDCDVEYQLSYAEGGNTLSWTQNNEVFCIIGKDTLAVTKYLAAQHLGKKDAYNNETVTDFAKMMLAIDYGTKVENLFFVEQPGEFHLDMRMAIAGHKTVIINDSIAAHKMMIEFFDQVEYL